jgi:hypothetical protein
MRSQTEFGNEMENPLILTMKSLLNAFVLVFAFVCLWIAGCSRPPTQPKGEIKKIEIKGSDAFKAALETFRYSENTRAGDDWLRFRSGFDLLQHHFSKPEVTERIRELSTKNRSFLEKNVGLTQEELAEVESTSFRTADAHYLDKCFLLRDAARSLDISGLSPLEKAHFHFRWVMRNVLPHEQIASWVPPAFTLRRGFGSPLDRALLFLALLRQSEIEGCLIVVPDAEPKQFLVAVLDPNPKTPHLYLFDTRLGLALTGKDGAGILTLKDALDAPTLLKPAMISPDQAKKLEAWLVCPLYALPPRLFELQTRLSKHESIVLWLNTPELFQDITRATSLPVKVWNFQPQSRTAPNSPTRALRRFLPKQEGGLDETKLAAQVTQARVPFQNALFNYAQINLTRDLLTNTPFQLLQGLTADFFNKYDLQTREMYLRGQYDSMIRRHERLQLFTTDELLAGLLDDRNFRKEAAAWQTGMREAHAALGDPQTRAQAQQLINSLWSQDLFVRWMIEISKEEGLERKHEKTVLTKILAVGMRDYFDLELAHVQACTNHEKAEHAQATLQTHKNPAANAQNRVRDAWVIAKNSWANFYLDRIALDYMIKQRLDQIRDPLRPDEIEQRIAMLETLHLDVHKYIQARLRLAECFEGLGDKAKAKEQLERAKSEIEALEKKGLLQAKIKHLGDTLQIFPGAKARLDLLARDWSDAGNYFWIKRHIEQKIGLPSLKR